MANTILFIKKSLRSLRTSKSRSLPILIIIIVGGFTAIPFFSFQTSMNDVIDASWNGLDYQDALLTVTPSTYQSLMNNISSVIHSTHITPKIEIRSFFVAGVKSAGSSKLIDSHIIAVNTSASHQIQVNKLYLDSGSSLQNSSQFNAVVVDNYQAQHYKWNVPNTNLSVTASFGQFSVSTVGYVDSPEYLLIPSPDAQVIGAFLGPVLWMRLSYLIALDNTCAVMNDIALKFDNQQNLTYAFITAFNKEIGPENVISIEGQDPNVLLFRNIFTPLSIGLSAIFIVLSAFILYIILSRIIEEEKTLLGLFKAMGMNIKELIVNVLSFGIVLSIIGGIIGTIGGYLIGIGFGSLITLYFKKLPSVGLPLDPIPAMYYLIATLLVATLSSLLASRKAFRLSPQAAIRTNTNLEPGKKPLLEQFMQRFFKLPPLSKFSVRSVFRRKRKSLITTFGILIAIAVIFSGITFELSYNNSLNQRFSYYETWNLQVLFTHNIPATNLSTDLNTSYLNTNSICSNSTSTNCYEGTYIATGKFAIDLASTYQIIGFEPNTTMHHFDAGITLMNDSLYISADLANKYHFNVNTNVEMIVPNNKTLVVHIGAILYEGAGNTIYTTINTARDIDGLFNSAIINGIFIKTTNTTAITQSLTNNPLVDKIINKADIARALHSYDEFYAEFIGMLVGSGVIIGLAVVIAVISITIAERRNDFINFRALGVSNREIFETIALEIFIAGIIGIILGILLGMEASIILADWMANVGFPIKPTWDISAFIGTIVLTLIGLLITAYLSLRSLFKTNIGKFTHEQMFG